MGKSADVDIPIKFGENRVEKMGKSADIGMPRIWAKIGWKKWEKVLM